jgi:hypothetical protein
MTWAKVCDTAHSHPKMLEAGLEAVGLWTLALSHCAAYLTDGHVKRSAAERLAGAHLDRLAGRLVHVGLWEVHPSGDGWQVHDFLEFNPSRAAAVALRGDLSTKRSEAGRRGAAARWQKDGKPSFCHEANAVLPSVLPDGKNLKNAGNSLANDGKRDGKPVANDGPDPDPDPDPREGERERARRTPVTGETTKPVPAPSGVILVGEPVLELSTPITEELRSIAQGATGAAPVQDVDGAWRKFCGLKVGMRMQDVAGRWQIFCVTEAKIERRERDQRQRREAEQAAKNNPAESVVAREKRRHRNDGYDDAKRNAVRGAEAARAGALALEVIAAARRKATS